MSVLLHLLQTGPFLSQPMRVAVLLYLVILFILVSGIYQALF